MHLKVKKKLMLILSLSYLLSYDGMTSFNIQYETNDLPDSVSYKKPNMKAFLMSGLFSGAGYFYLEDWKKGLIYSGVEISGWYIKNESENNNAYYTDSYKNYADDHWTFSKWVKDYYIFNDPSNPMYNAFINNENLNDIYYVDPWKQAHGIAFYYNSNRDHREFHLQ